TDGTLSFEIVWSGGTRESVTMRFAKEAESIAPELVDFKDSQTTGLNGSIQELRIPEYTRTIEIPITLPGLHSTDEKKRDDFRRSLTTPDREAFDRFRRSQPECMIGGSPEGDQLREAVQKHCPDLGSLKDAETPPTAAQIRCMAEAMVASLR